MSRQSQSARGAASLEVWDAPLRLARGSLFERLVADEEDLPLPDDRDATGSRVRSVKRHLVKLLNSREGGAASAPRLGTADFNDATTESRDMTKHIAASIRRCIEDNEPRVRVKSVHHIPDPDRPLHLQFSIVTSMLIGDKAQQVQIDLLMEDGKNFRVR